MTGEGRTDEIDALRDVQDRLLRAAEQIGRLSTLMHLGTPERSRLRGKREGILLAESYVAEALRSPSYPPAQRGMGVTTDE